jgi:phosphatidylglycerophosphate synthase
VVSVHFIPNAFSVSRIVLGLAFPFVPPDWRLWVIVVAAVTDVLDGLTARWLHAESNAGRLLDPIADKVFVLIVAVTLLVEGAIHPLWALGVAARDVVVLVGLAYLTATRQWAVGRRLRPSWLGKCTTAVQFALLLVLVIWGEAPVWLLVPTVVLSAAAAVDYAVNLFRLFKADRSDGPDRVG